MESLPALLDLATAYHGCGDVDALLKACAAALGARLEARGVLVWLLTDAGDSLVCRAQWLDPGLRVDPSPGPVTEGMLVGMLEEPRAVQLAADALDPANLSHLSEDHRGRVKTALYAPLPGDEGAAGVVEVLNKRRGDFDDEDAAFAEEALQITARALATLRRLEKQTSDHLATIERMTQLYDLSRVFNSSLELSDLLPHIAERIGDILGAQACNLWLVDADSGALQLRQQAGDDPTADEDVPVPPGEGVLGGVAKDGEARLVADATHEPLLADRRQRGGEFELATLMAAPLSKDGRVLGVVELVNKTDDSPFTEDDLFFLTTLTEQAAIALYNAELLDAERKVHQLGALLAISKEITATLNLDKILLTVVNQAATVLPFERCAIGLFDRGKFELAAVSGHEAVPKTDEMRALGRVVEWAARQDGASSADKSDAGWSVEPEGAREVLPAYLDGAGFAGFFAVPLADEQGALGAIAVESTDAEFLNESHREVLSLLVSQTTVAVRNAQLYQQVPLISVMQPLLARQARLMALPRARLVRLGVQLALATLVLVGVPWKMRIGAHAQVVPAERRAVVSEVRGVIRQVLVHEGDAVEAGAVLAELDAGDDRVNLERAQAALALAQQQFAEAEARSDLGAAGQAQLRAEMARAETALYRERVDKSRLRAPLAGVVVTPRVEDKAGEQLERGTTFCELVRADRLAVTMNVPETAIGLIAQQRHVSLKLNAFPTRTFEGRVDSTAAQAVAIEGEQYFEVRAGFLNTDLAARPGMVGRAKIVASGGWAGSGWYPVGYVLLRDPARWAWRKIWGWLP